ncbi:MAG: ABC transporter permease [Acidobacteriaceae bacterium]|jgi:predicted permease
MKFLAWLRPLAAKFFHRAQLSDEMDQELRSHIQLRADDLERSGIPRAEAERLARIEFGAYQRYKEESHEALGGNFIETFLQDLRLSLRVLRKSPGFTVTAVLTLALAIGANAVVFSVLNAFILHPRYVPQAESLYGIEHGSNNGFQSYPDYLDLRDRNHSFDGLAAFTFALVGLDTGNNASATWLNETSGNYFDALRIRPYLGRVYHSSDEHGPNSAPYIVLTYAYWHTHFQNDRGVLGRVVQVNKHPFTILGVTPPAFHGTLLFFYPDFFVPIVNHEQVDPEYDLNSRGIRWIFEAAGHLKPGVTPAQAIADLNSIGAYLKETYPKDEGNVIFTLARPSLYGDYLGRPVRAFLAGLMLLAGLILLAACANLGCLFAARAADRSREVALRLALGSSRRRILRGLFTEAVLISLAGGAVGLLGSIILLRGLSAWQPFHQWPMLHMPVNPDASVYSVALVLALASGFLFGAVPVRQVLRTNPYEVVKSGSSGGVGRRITARDLLLVAQIAICAVLVTSSMVALRGLVRSLYGNYGFDLRNTMVASTDLSMAGYRGDKIPAMQKRMIEAVQAIAGVESVGLADNVPLGTGSNASIVYSDKTTDLRPSNATANAQMFSISPEYFNAAGTALLSGRTFTWHDDQSSPRTAVVNGEFARKVLGSATNVVGGYYKMRDGTRVQVVGIAEDGKYNSLTEDPMPAMFLPILQSPSSSTILVVRSSSDPQQLAAAIRRTLHDLDAGLPVDIQTRYQGLDIILFGPRMATIALGLMGIMGAMLSITGIFGMAAYSVSKRLREIGIRIALGARRKEVLEAALGRAVKLLALGSAAGLLLGLLATRVLAFIVYQATPRDPLVLAGVVLGMSLLGLLATWIPALRALSVDPVILLRAE